MDFLNSISKTAFADNSEDGIAKIYCIMVGQKAKERMNMYALTADINANALENILKLKDVKLLQAYCGALEREIYHNPLFITVFAEAYLGDKKSATVAAINELLDSEKATSNILGLIDLIEAEVETSAFVLPYLFYIFQTEDSISVNQDSEIFSNWFPYKIGSFDLQECFAILNNRQESLFERLPAAIEMNRELYPDTFSLIMAAADMVKDDYEARVTKLETVLSTDTGFNHVPDYEVIFTKGNEINIMFILEN